MSGPTVALARERAILASLRRAGSAFFGRFGRLSPIQAAAIPTVLSGADTMLCAPTAGGKTEAVAAPLAERHLADPPDGLALLYVCPTRALVNDLHRRLQAPLARLGIAIGRKTSDHPVTSRGRLEPWLVTTPESFDSLLVRRPADLTGVRAVVLDEIHLFDGTPRGDQLRLLMARLRRVHEAAVARGDRPAAARLQTVLVSATMADPEGTAVLYAPGATAVRVEGKREIQTLGTQLGSAGTIGRALASLPRDEARKVLIFARSRAECEEVASALSGKPPYGHHVFAHHASLSRRARMAAEEAFHRAAYAVFVATTTLELGIDIGDVDWVVQFGPPASVGSFLQQIGRGCRRRRDVTKVLAVARGAAEEIVFEVLLAMARRGAVERPSRVLAASVLVQQTASYLLQRSSGTVGRAELEALLGPAAPAFSDDLRAVLASMVEHELLVGARGGRFAVGPALERWFERDPRKLHTNLGMPRGMVAVYDADTHEHLGDVQRRGVPAAGRVAFGGRGGSVSRSEDRRIYLARQGREGGSAPTYWTQRGAMSLALAQGIREQLGLPAQLVAVLRSSDEKSILFTFLGGCANQALAAHLRLGGTTVRRIGDVAITVDHPPLVGKCRASPEELARAAETVWKQIERLQDAGAHAALVPEAVRCRQVLARIADEGAAGVIGGWRELASLEGNLAAVLMPFRE